MVPIIWLTLWALVLAPVQASNRSAEPGLLIPGGTARLLAVAGIRAPVERDRAMLMAIRSLHQTRSVLPGSGPGPGVQRQLGAAAKPGNGGDRVPALLPHALWERAVFGEKVGVEALAARILADREAALLYYGLFSLDDETLAFFVDHPSLVSTIYRRHAGAFAAFADSVAVHDGRVSLPGAASAAERWEALVGAPAAKPESFIIKLLERDQGRLAWLFDTIGRLQGPRQAFAIGPRRDDLKWLYESFARFDDGWLIPDAPFVRYAKFDAAMILQRIAATPDGEMAPPGGRDFWSAVFKDRRSLGGSAPETPVGQSGRAADPSEDVRAWWLVDRFVAVPVRQRRAHLNAVLFAQRLAETAARKGVAVDGSSLVEALSAFPEHEALIVTLERMGFADSRDYQRSVRAAAALTSGFDEVQQALRLAIFQGALALTARLEAVGAVSADAACDLARSLFQLASADEARFPGAVADWIESALLPALPPETQPATGTAEARLVSALAGRPADQSAPTVDWEGARYRVDLAAAERVRLRRILRKLGGRDLDSALELGRSISRLTAASSAAATARGEASQLLERLPELMPSGGTTMFLAPIGGTLDALLARVRRIAEGRADPKSGDTQKTLAAGLAVALADVIAARVYAVATGDPDAPLLLADEPSRHHDFALIASPEHGPWLIATVLRSGSAVAAKGSLLALERALARYWLRPTTLASPVTRPWLWEQEIQGLAESVAAFNPFELTDDVRDTIAAAIGRGRRRLADAAGRPDDVDRLAAKAGVEGWRRRLIRLAAASNPAAVASYFSLGEALSLGLEGPMAPALSVWGLSMRPVDGSLERRLPTRLDWDEMAGHQGLNLLSTRVADLQLRVAERLAELKLPAVLAPGIMARATWDLAMNTQMADRDDWLAVLRAAQGLSADRMADYISALTADGPLVPVAGEGIQP